MVSAIENFASLIETQGLPVVLGAFALVIYLKDKTKWEKKYDQRESHMQEKLEVVVEEVIKEKRDEIDTLNTKIEQLRVDNKKEITTLEEKQSNLIRSLMDEQKEERIAYRETLASFQKTVDKFNLTEGSINKINKDIEFIKDKMVDMQVEIKEINATKKD